MNQNQTGEYRVINAQDIMDPPHPDRLEVTSASVEDLVVSMKLIGHKTPITVRPMHSSYDATDCNQVGLQSPCTKPSHYKYEVVAGHRRFLACKIVGIINIKCIVEKLTDDEADEVKAHENLYRKDLDPIEEAVAISRIIGEDQTKIPELARRRGKSVAWVEERLNILTYPDYFLEAIRNEKIKLGVAKALAQIDDEFYRKLFFDQAVRDGMTVWQAEYHLIQWQGGTYKSSEDILPPGDEDRPIVQAVIKQQCEICLGVALAPNLRTAFIHVECPALKPAP